MIHIFTKSSSLSKIRLDLDGMGTIIKDKYKIKHSFEELIKLQMDMKLDVIRERDENCLVIED